MSLLRYLAAIAFAITLFATAPASAATPGFSTDAPASAFSEPALSDVNLSSIRGTSSPRSQFMRTVASAEARSFERQVGSISTITFDNWFNDVGSALIFNNILDARGR